MNPREQISLDLESITLSWQQCEVFKFRARARCTVGSEPHKKSHGPCKAARRRPNEVSRQQNRTEQNGAASQSPTAQVSLVSARPVHKWLCNSC